MTEQQTETEEHKDTQVSPGQSLRAAREASGLTQQALADKLFLKVNIIQELEADELDPKTSVTFTKGYIRLYAKNVNLDPAPLLAAFEERNKVTKPHQKLQSFSQRVSKEANDDRWMMVTYVILAIVIALFVIWWYQQSENTDISMEQSVNITPPSTVDNSRTTSPQSANGDIASSTIEPNTLATVSESVDELAEEITESADSALLNAEEAFQDEAETETINDDLQGSAPLSDALSNDSAEQLEGESIELVFTFSEDCWVNIVDATGEAIAFGVKAKGRVMPVSGNPPFSVTLGAPQVVSITYAGDAVDLSNIPAGRTARFELPMQE